MKFTERLPKESARDYTYRIIKDNIVRLVLKPGSFVSENELASELGLSRTPVREALIELSKSRIVEIYPQKGSYISLIDYNMVEEAQFLRLVLEKAIIDLACDVAKEDDLLLLEENLHMQEFYLEKSSSKLLELDNQFHHLLFTICNKERTYALLEGITTHFDRVRSLSLTAIKNIKIVEDHWAILNAIKEKDKEKAKALVIKHLSRYKIDEESLRKEYPQYFS